MTKTLKYAIALLLLLSLTACGRPAAPAAEPTTAPTETPAPGATATPTSAAPAETPEAAPTPAPEPTPEPDDSRDPLERALAFLRGWDAQYASKHINTCLELYRMTHPGANVAATGWTVNAGVVELDLTGLDARAFAESGYLPESVHAAYFGYANEFVPLDEPIPREPEWDRVSEQEIRVAMDRADWPVGAEYVRFTMRNEGEEPWTYGEDVELQKYVEGEWLPLRHSGLILAIGNILNPGQEVSLGPPLVYYPALGEGLYRVGFIGKDAWAEFAVRAEAEPLDPAGWRSGFPEAALLLAGLPETVDSELTNAARWPVFSSTWELREDRKYTDAELAALLLGEGAEYDASARVYRLGDGALSLEAGAVLERDLLLVRALRLTLPPAEAGTLASGEIPSPEQAGWVNGTPSALIPPLDSLYPNITGKRYAPDADILNERLETALEALGDEAGELRDFRFTREDLRDLQLMIVPVCTEGEVPHTISLCSPYGELAGAAAWCVYRDSFSDGRELLLLSARYPGYSLTPGEQQETRSPLEQAELFLPLLQGEEDLRLVSFDYVLIPDGNDADGNTLRPVYRLQAATGSGEERTYVVSAVSRRASAYELRRRARLHELRESRAFLTVFQSWRERFADVWESYWGIDRLEDGREYLVVGCYGVDIPALEASGDLPEGVALSWTESPFDQKEAHPCPREPEWEKKYWSDEREDAVTLAMAQPVYPLYPPYVEVTVRCKKTFDRDWYRFCKYVDGEWKDVFRILSGTQQFLYVEAGETVLQIPTRSMLGEGLYRVYINQEYWVEFQVSGEAPLPAP